MYKVENGIPFLFLWGFFRFVSVGDVGVDPARKDDTCNSKHKNNYGAP